jgi:hypothetical protein
MKKYVAQIERAWLAANIAAWNSACLSVTSYASAATAHAVGTALNFEVAALSLKQLGSIFVVAFAWHFFGWFADHPIRLEPVEVKG